MKRGALVLLPAALLASACFEGQRTIRVKADLKAIQDHTTYEAWSCLKPGQRFRKDADHPWGWADDGTPVKEQGAARFELERSYLVPLVAVRTNGRLSTRPSSCRSR